MAPDKRSASSTDPVRKALQELVDEKRGIFPSILESFPEIIGLLPAQLVSDNASISDRARTLNRLLDHIFKESYLALQKSQSKGSDGHIREAGMLLAAGAAIGRITSSPVEEPPFDWSRSYESLCMAREPSREARRAHAGRWLVRPYTQNTHEGFRKNYEPACLALLHERLLEDLADSAAEQQLTGAIKSSSPAAQDSRFSELPSSDESIAIQLPSEPPAGETIEDLFRTVTDISSWWPHTRRRRCLMLLGATLAVVTALAVIIFITLNDNNAHKDVTVPVLIEAVSPLKTGANGSFVIPGSLKLSPLQLAMFTPPTDGPHKPIQTGSGYVTVTLVSNTNKPVTISNISIDKKVCTEPATGTLFFAPPAGQNSNIGIGFDLDLASPPAQEEHNGRLTGDYFRDYNITVSPNELPQTLSLYATTNKYDCTFRFQLTIATSNGTTTEYIPQNGSFTLTSIRHTTANLVDVDFSYYQAVYVTGIAAQPAVPGYIQVNPKTYQGVGNAASFPPTP